MKNNIQRYTKGRFSRIEKHDEGEFVYWVHHNDAIKKHIDLEEFLSKGYELLSYKHVCLKDKLIQTKLSTKKYKILAWLSFLVNVGLIGYIGSHYL